MGVNAVVDDKGTKRNVENSAVKDFLNEEVNAVVVVAEADVKCISILQ